MAALAVCLVLFLALTGHSTAIYCICKDGVGDSILQKNIDYACGAGADCTAILQNGPCFNPNSVKDHCNYAVNSYFQKKGQATGSCDFQSTATISQTPPSGQSTSCVYASSTSNTGNTPNFPSPTTNNPSPNTPSVLTPPGSTFPGTLTPPMFGLGPAGNGGITNTDGSAAVTLHPSTSLFYSLTLALLFSGLICLRA